MRTHKRIAISLLTSICFAIYALDLLAAEQIGLDRLHFLVGEWRGVGEGKWGSSSAERRYHLIFGQTFIQGHGRSVYPRQDRNKEGESHESLDIFSFDEQRQRVVLRQFDNEGFVTTYYLNSETSERDRLIFEAEHLENVPTGWKAKIIFEVKEKDEFHEHFYLDTATGAYERYLTTRFLKIPE